MNERNYCSDKKTDLLTKYCGKKQINPNTAI